VLQAIESATGGTISPSDFFPVCVGAMLEPFLPLLGYGRYQIRPSPFCGFATCLVTTKKRFSTPVSRLLDIDRLRAEIQPLLPDLVKDEIGIFTLGRLKTVIDACKRPGVKIPSLIPFIFDRTKRQETQQFLDEAQFIVLHNYMDLGSLDLARRCACSSLAPSALDGAQLAASCNGCF